MIMPPYYSTEGLTRVGRAWLDRPVMTAEQIGDVVAFLTTLKEAP
jgi:sulfur-oxidizing protein SoxX